MLVVNAGLDMILRISVSGEILEEWPVLSETLWARFSKNVDYRKIETKPHKSHPNFVFCTQKNTWVTRSYQKDAICLTEPYNRIAIDIGNPQYES
ncbi:hypothetical protein [Candidatus Uabimicrobium sp. HlEnr_7]|uniref:hypothetical protein n=1 Tax=Candidatus Uabimicrobium helgolandensis TaxID=3095367 RepID=UPI003555C480